MRPLPLLPDHPVGFPDPNSAMDDPDGLLAAGGALSNDWLIAAYAHGIFPWFDADDQHILWWSPKQRAVIRPGSMRVSRSLRKRIRNAGFRASMDKSFSAVIASCQAPRPNQQGTWITADMQAAYRDLHAQGLAHSVEVWENEEIVGGLYGVSLGRYFFGESMFSRRPDASKIAFYVLHQQLKKWRFSVIDCQILNPHLASLGVAEMSRAEFLQGLADNPIQETRHGRWFLDDSLANLDIDGQEQPSETR